jgi:hypothetical protein
MPATISPPAVVPVTLTVVPAPDVNAVNTVPNVPATVAEIDPATTWVVLPGPPPVTETVFDPVGSDPEITPHTSMPPGPALFAATCPRRDSATPP